MIPVDDAALDNLSSAAWSVLNDATRSQLRGMTCKQARKRATSLNFELAFCPVCRKNVKRSCELKSGVWPPEDTTNERAAAPAHRYISPEKAAAASSNVVKKVHLLMVQKFGRRCDEDGRSLVLKQAQIRGYFSRRTATMKRRAVDDALRGDDEGDEGDGGDKLDDSDGGGEYDDLKVEELKSLLRERGLSLAGRKSELTARLYDDDRDAEEEPADSATPPKRRKRSQP